MAEDLDVTIRIRVLNPQGEFLEGSVDIDFENQVLTDTRQLKALAASKDIDVVGLNRFP